MSLQDVLDARAAQYAGTSFGRAWLRLAENFYHRHDGNGCRITRIRSAIGDLR